VEEVAEAVATLIMIRRTVLGETVIASLASSPLIRW
jgi:hypothetical protein